MPFLSLAQEGWAHEHPEKFGKSNLKDWDAATKGMHLPKHILAIRTAPQDARKALLVNHQHFHHNIGPA